MILAVQILRDCRHFHHSLSRKVDAGELSKALNVEHQSCDFLVVSQLDAPPFSADSTIFYVDFNTKPEKLDLFHIIIAGGWQRSRAALI